MQTQRKRRGREGGRACLPEGGLAVLLGDLHEGGKVSVTAGLARVEEVREGGQEADDGAWREGWREDESGGEWWKNLEVLFFTCIKRQ
jgi:hypothetical protein